MRGEVLPIEGNVVFVERFGTTIEQAQVREGGCGMQAGDQGAEDRATDEHGDVVVDQPLARGAMPWRWTSYGNRAAPLSSAP